MPSSSIPEMLDTANINKRLDVIEQILERHAKVLDAIYTLHGRKKSHWAETRQTLKQK
jgi:hypothetical protein